MLLERGEPNDREKAKKLLAEATELYERLGMAHRLQSAQERTTGLG